MSTDRRHAQSGDRESVEQGVVSALEELEPQAGAQGECPVQSSVLPTCEQVRENLVSHLKRELPQEQRGPLDVHLETCRACRAEAESLASTLGVAWRLEDEAPTIKLVNSILQHALRSHASDLHIEPGAKSTRVRIRLDGVLHEAMKLPGYAHDPLVSRFKLMAEMNTAERRLPQDGRIHIHLDKRDYQLRASTFPFQHGEKVMLRVLPSAAWIPSFERMGMTTEQQEQVRALLRRPPGLLLVAGPTGCGKTTVAYSLLNELNADAHNVVTIEDPVECVMPEVVQSHVNRKAGLTFAVAVRELLERDPDVIFVGELRDRQTAEAVLEAATTGHLVIAVMHARDAAGAIDRLLRLGTDARTLAASLLGVVSSRLVRRVCEHCSGQASPAPESVDALGVRSDFETRFRCAAGCEQCRYSGYRGRIGAFEVIESGDAVTRAIARREDEESLFEALAAGGAATLEHSAACLAEEGVTTVEEVLRVTGDLRERRHVL